MSYGFGDFELDTERFELRRAGVPVPLEPQVFELLVYLVANRDRVVTRRELHERVWHGRIVTDAALNSRIKAARAALGDDGKSQHAIRTLHRTGYRFIGDVTEVANGARPPPAPPVGVAISLPVGAPAAGPTRSPEARRFGSYLAVAAAAGAAVATAGYWTMTRDDDADWLAAEAVPRIEAYLDDTDWESAYRLANEAEARVPGDADVAALWPRITWRVTIASEPAGATVLRQPYGDPTAEWEVLGKTPLTDIRFPWGLSRVRFELDGHRTLERALGGGHFNWQELGSASPQMSERMLDQMLVGPDVVFKLDTAESLPSGMVRVPGWLAGAGAAAVEARDFLLGRHEVTNSEYKAFVDAGGYRREELWDPVVVDGKVLRWDEAMRLFVDRTGRVGPSTWEGSDYPTGEADYPVSGVSWYEASAYARYAGRELPTAPHWQRALANSMFPWLLPASNFGGKGPQPGAQSPAMTHVGAYDMTGNVREWTASAIGDERVILGGAWSDPYYIAGVADSSAPPLDRSPSNGVRLALTHDDAAVAEQLRAPLQTRTTASEVGHQEPVGDDVYAAYSRAFDYDRKPLNAVVESTDPTRVWVRERIRLDAAYGEEHLLLHLYLPTVGTPPYQTVVYWPGWDTFGLDDIDEYFAKQLDFVVKSGRAVAFPMYKGSFERRIGNSRVVPPFDSAAYRDNTIDTVKDLRRSVDYLETRGDIDANALAFFGYSWGGVNGPTALAQEPRFRAAVIDIGLLPPMTTVPEVDPVNALPRARLPLLMLSTEFDAMVPPENARRYFDLIGTPAADKRHVMVVGGHFMPRAVVIRETSDWLDARLGPVGTASVAR
jgi:DNA-binding winged helix-turn-helix (wHTH) protein/formylglycine-generating enzyme required for sulfatase activity/dienelactone hydrolase